jgi:hypothetical protein
LTDIGVDIGLTGGIALLTESGDLLEVHDMPCLADGLTPPPRPMAGPFRCSLGSLPWAASGWAAQRGRPIQMASKIRKMARKSRRGDDSAATSAKWLRANAAQLERETSK